MKNYIYIPVITILTAVLWFLLTAIFPSETLATWWNGVIWLAVFLVRLALLLVMLAVILLGALFLGLMGFVALDSLNEWINSVTNQTGHMSGLQHLLAGIVIGLIIGVAWIVGMPYTVDPRWSWVGNVFDLFAFNGFTGFDGPPVGWGVLAAIEAWFAYFVAYDIQKDEYRRQNR